MHTGPSVSCASREGIVHAVEFQLGVAVIHPCPDERRRRARRRRAHAQVVWRWSSCHRGTLSELAADEPDEGEREHASTLEGSTRGAASARDEAQSRHGANPGLDPLEAIEVCEGLRRSKRSIDGSLALRPRPAPTLAREDRAFGNLCPPRGISASVPSSLPRWLAPITLAGALLGCAHAPATAHPLDATIRSPLRDRATSREERLVAFARLYGYVRFFHPTDAAERADWQRLALAGADLVDEPATLDELAARLDALFRPLAPTLQLWVDGEPVPEAPPTPHPRDGLVYWQYQGYPGTPLSMFKPPYGKVRVQPGQSYRRRFSETPQRDARVQTELAPALRMRLPVVLDGEQASAGDGRPSAMQTEALARHEPSEVGDLAVRRAAVIEVWNVMRHFYPYQHELEIDWDATLLSALHDAEDDASPEDFRDTLRGLLEPLEDGHGFVGHDRHDRDGVLPVRMELVEGKPVITGTRDPERFAVGDVVERIGDVPALPHIEGIAERLSGTPQWRSFRAAAWEATRAQRGRSVELVLEREGQRRRVMAEAERAPVPIEPRPPAIHAFDDGVAYVDLTRATWEEIEPELPWLAAAPGVVFDMRGYPKDNDAILDHLLDAPEDSLWMHVPHVVEPDGEIAGWRDLGWHRRPAEPHIDAPVTFLVSAEAISYAESMLSYVEAHELGTLVGSPSAGANGDIVRLDTLAGFFVVYSGMRVTRHDGRPFHADGVRPDLEVQRTIAGLRAGRDEVLEAGLGVIRSAPRATVARGTKRGRGVVPRRPTPTAEPSSAGKRGATSAAAAESRPRTPPR